MVGFLFLPASLLFVSVCDLHYVSILALKYSLQDDPLFPELSVMGRRRVLKKISQL